MTLFISVLKKLWDLPNNNIKDKHDSNLLNILAGLKDLLRVFSSK